MPKSPVDTKVVKKVIEYKLKESILKSGNTETSAGSVLFFKDLNHELLYKKTFTRKNLEDFYAAFSNDLFLQGCNLDLMNGYTLAYHETVVLFDLFKARDDLESHGFIVDIRIETPYEALLR